MQMASHKKLNDLAREKGLEMHNMERANLINQVYQQQEEEKKRSLKNQQLQDIEETRKNKIMRDQQDWMLREIEMKLPGSNSLFESHEKIKEQQRERFQKFTEQNGNALQKYQDMVYKKKQQDMMKEVYQNEKDREAKQKQQDTNE